MSSTIEMVILTESSKNGGHCVAGINTENSRWVRLVSNDACSHGALFDRNMRYRDGSLCQILDVVRVPILQPIPSAHQPENVLIDESKVWSKTGQLSVEELTDLHPEETHQYLLGNVYSYITEERIDTVGHSLILVRVNNLEISHPDVHSTKASFRYKYTSYENMAVTDRDYYHVSNGTIFNEAILVMSLPDAPINERWYYKFIAKIFPL